MVILELINKHAGARSTALEEHVPAAWTCIGKEFSQEGMISSLIMWSLCAGPKPDQQKPRSNWRLVGMCVGAGVALLAAGMPFCFPLQELPEPGGGLL